MEMFNDAYDSFMAPRHKALYESPTMLVVEVKPEGILCGSPKSELDVFFPVEDL